MDIELLPAKRRYTWYERGDKNFPREMYGKVIEDAVGRNMTATQIMEKYKISYDLFTEILSLYYRKPQCEVTLKSKV